MYAIKIHRLILGAALIALCVPVAMAQSDATAAQKRAAIKELMEVSGMQRYAASTYQDFLTRYQQNWAEGVIAGFREKGLLKPLTPEDAAKIEQLVHQFSNRMFSQTKRRVAEEITTADNLTALAEPTFDKYLTADEINQLLAFCKTPTGRKLTDEYYKLMSEALRSFAQSTGVFDMATSPEAEMAKAERFGKETEKLRAGGVGQLMASVKIPPGYFTEAEAKEIAGFYQTPLGKKLTAVSRQMLSELMAASSLSYAPRVGRLFREVYSEQMQWFNAQTREVLKNYDAQGRKKPARAQ